MTLRERLRDDTTAAMRSREALRLDVLRLVNNAIYQGQGTMVELLCAIEEKRQPSNDARSNLRSLELSFAAVASAMRHEPIVPGTVRRLPDPPSA